ncbi:MAG: YccF domain-containing protein [Solirubrobacteraceae bacterium]
MRFLLNIIWLILCGFWMAVLYVIAGVVMCVLIITIPFGLQAFKLAGFMLWPFGRTVVRRDDAGAASVIGNVLWVVLVGWELAIGHIVTAFLLAITIIGIPFAVANLKLVPISLLPFGRQVVPADQAAATGAAFF